MRLDVKDSSGGQRPHTGLKPMSDAVGHGIAYGERLGGGPATAVEQWQAQTGMQHLLVPPGPPCSAVHPLHCSRSRIASSSRAVAGHEATAARPLCQSPTHRPTQQHPQPGKALESSASGNAMEREAGPPSAMEFVESWLVQLLDREQPAELCSRVAAQLAAAISSDACLMSCVVAGFESTLLRIVPLPERRVLSSRASSSNTASAGNRLAASQHMVQPMQESARTDSALMCRGARSAVEGCERSAGMFADTS